ncbi:hypothetical protein GP486_006315, partial [Trichoglossum hirsutum]
MLSTLFAVALSLITLSSASTLPIVERDSGYLNLPIVATNWAGQTPGSKRQDVPLANTLHGTLYLVNFTIGTPPQPVSVQIDTGSAETWVDPVCSTAGGPSKIALCNSLPVYHPASSSTGVRTGSSNVLSYGTGHATIDYYTDNFILGGTTIVAQKFGVATSSQDIGSGIMGVGPELTGLTTYPLVIDQLALQGKINSRAFSLDLRNVDDPNGSIIFGGVDTKKYTGHLEKRPIIPAASAPKGGDRYWIYMTSLGITKPGQSPKSYTLSGGAQGQPVFLDSGATLSGLPPALAAAIVADFPGATLDPSTNLYTVDCAVASQAGTVDFGFGNTTIHVPYHEFIWRDPTGTCNVGVEVATDGEPVLGDSFLRAAYVVYDQDNQNIHVANAANCGTNVVTIGKGPDAVPSITGACNANSTAPTTPKTSTSPPSSPSPTKPGQSTVTPKPTSTNPVQFTGDAGMMKMSVAAVVVAVLSTIAIGS